MRVRPRSCRSRPVRCPVPSAVCSRCWTPIWPATTRSSRPSWRRHASSRARDRAVRHPIRREKWFPMDVLSTLSALRLLPVVVLDDASAADALAGALVDGGLPVAEVTFRTAAAQDSIRVMAERGDVLVGAGTVVSVAQVDQAVAAGARFVVSPGLSRAVVELSL